MIEFVPIAADQEKKGKEEANIGYPSEISVRRQDQLRDRLTSDSM